MSLIRHIITPRTLSMLTFGLISLACLSFSAHAEETPLQSDHPNQYTVVKGDTLWGISSKFLKNPWQWPKVWQMNRAEIKNPHRIYPGDVVVLDTSSGQPVFKLLKQTVTLEPGVIVTPIKDEAISTIQPDVILPFLTKPLMVEPEVLEKSPRIVAAQDNRLVLSPGTRIYVKNLPETSDKRYWSIYRPGKAILDPVTGEILGTEANYLGEAQVIKQGSPATLNVSKAIEEIFVKDRLVESAESFENSFLPHAPEKMINGQIIKIPSGVAETSVGNVVMINRGSKDGLETGHVLSIQRASRVIMDPEATKNAEDREIRIPEERVGLLMIFKTYQRVSYGLIMQASTSIYAVDKVSTP